MPKELNIEDWSRKEQYKFFKQFEEPFFGFTVDLDCTRGYRRCKDQGHSFFLYYLYQSLKAANEIESFRYRMIDDKVMIYEQVHAGSTVNRPDGTFGFGYFKYASSFTAFELAAKEEIVKVQQSKSLIPSRSGENVIHYSSLPWIKFTALSHARSFSFNDSCPKISFGKMTEEGGKRHMPVSIHVHHALMDGYHVGQYIERFQHLMNQE